MFLLQFYYRSGLLSGRVSTNDYCFRHVFGVHFDGLLCSAGQQHPGGDTFPQHTNHIWLVHELMNDMKMKYLYFALTKTGVSNMKQFKDILCLRSLFLCVTTIC